jgi:hypothetical protein
MTTSGQRIEIELSKKKLFIMLLGALVFVAIGLWFVISPPTISNSYWGNPAKIAIAGYASILIFGLCAFILIKKLPDNKPGLIIDQMDLTDNSSGVSAGQILWSDIEDISVIEIHRQKLIMLQVANPQDYIDKQTSSFKRKMMQLNYKMYGTPLSITPNGLKISFDELLSTLTDRLKAARQ